MDKLCNEIRQYYGSSDLYLKFITLFEQRLDRLREQNDAAPQEEVAKNQGAIRELKWFLSHLTSKSHPRDTSVTGPTINI